MVIGTASNVRKSNITFMKPLFNKQTLTYEDIRAIVDAFFLRLLEKSPRLFAILCGDQQVWIKLWMLHLQDPAKYNWVIPVPGEWHWLWHILKAIFKTYYWTILLPFSQVLNFKSLDIEVSHFHYSEDFFEMVTIALQRWIQECMAAFNDPTLTVIGWLDAISNNRVAYETAYACIYYFIPYWNTRSAIKWNKIDAMQQWWRYWLHLFIARGKRNYAAMTIRFLWVLRSMAPEIKELYDQYRVLSFSGDAGSGIPMDGVVELVCYNFITNQLIF